MPAVPPFSDNIIRYCVAKATEKSNVISLIFAALEDLIETQRKKQNTCDSTPEEWLGGVCLLHGDEKRKKERENGT